MRIIFFTVDRIISDIAVLMTDEEIIYELNITNIPFEISEGDILIGEITDGEVIISGKSTEEKQKRSERINSLFEKLKNKNRSEE